MLDLEKGEFMKTMNFQIKIPNLLVKLSNTYYAKLSFMTKNILNDGHTKNEEKKIEVNQVEEVKNDANNKADEIVSEIKIDKL